MSEVFNLRKGVLKFTLSLYNNPGISRNAVQEFITHLETFIADVYIPFLISKINYALSDISDMNILNIVRSVLDENKRPLSECSTEHARLKMFEKYCGYIPPEQYRIGATVDKGKEVQVNGTYIPLQSTLKSLLEIPGLFEEIIKYRDELINEKVIISNIIQAQMWKRKYESQNKFILPLFIYYDDFQPGNALGSHTGQQQLGGVYICLPFLPPHLVAKLNNIFLACIFYTHHRKQFGNEAVFQKIIESVNLLSLDGILINVNGIEHKVFFRCILLAGDNKGLNEIGGFVESFSSTRFCRLCTATSSKCQEMCEEDTSLLRTKENYIEDLKAKLITTGIKEPCIFNNIVDFHVIENKSTDLMHDWFEGIASYIISKVLTNLIFHEKLFTIDKLNERINNFDYNDLELRNKPQSILKDVPKKGKEGKFQDKIKLKQSASEMLCLTRYLSLIIGDLVPEKNRSWKLYLILHEIVSIVTAPSFVSQDISRVRYLVRKQNNLYIELFGPLKPKMHFAIHLPSIMRDNGPVIHFWSMGGERKNKMLKDIATNTNTNKNLPLTIAIKNQLHQCYIRQFCENVKTYIEVGTIKSGITESFPFIEKARTYSFINIYGTKHTQGTIIVINVTDDGPQFGRIKNIFEMSNEIYVSVSEIQTVLYNFKYRAYEVNITDKKSIHKCKSLPKIAPCLLVKILNQYYVATRYEI